MATQEYLDWARRVENERIQATVRSRKDMFRRIYAIETHAPFIPRTYPAPAPPPPVTPYNLVRPMPFEFNPHDTPVRTSRRSVFDMVLDGLAGAICAIFGLMVAGCLIVILTAVCRESWSNGSPVVAIAGGCILIRLLSGKPAMILVIAGGIVFAVMKSSGA